MMWYNIYIAMQNIGPLYRKPSIMVLLFVFCGVDETDKKSFEQWIGWFVITLCQNNKM